MTIPHFPWKRFWQPAGKSVNTESTYLYDPDAEHGSIMSPGTVSFEQIGNFSCLVLLAEPGMGKTTALHAEYEAIRQAVDAHTLFFNLRSFGSEDRIIRSVFGAPEFAAWVAGDYRLHLFLDSLDEGLLRVDTISDLLVDELKQCPVDRLSLRVACRTADWPDTLGRRLQTLWKTKPIGMFELAPLRELDVRNAALSSGLDPDAFLGEVKRVRAEPLARKPITLTMLMSLFAKGQSLPPTQLEVYERGCKVLCEDPSENRYETRSRGKLSASQRMEIAGRIAVATVFGNKAAIWNGLDLGTVPNEDISVSQLIPESEDYHSALVTEEGVRETLCTALFSSRGPKRIGWAHQTYAEFLASWYLMKINTPTAQILSMIVHPDSEPRFVPQLLSVAASLAGQSKMVLEEILAREPEVLFHCDPAAISDVDRGRITAALLSVFDRELSRDHISREQYSRLNHPELADKLRPYIGDRTKGFLVRRVAIVIAEACSLSELQDVLVDLALDSTEPHHTRVSAAFAISRMGDEETRCQLRPLLDLTETEDQDLQLYGYTLSALWPGLITAIDLFDRLSKPVDIDLYGAFNGFIHRRLTERLVEADLPAALQWVASLPARRSLPYHYRKPVTTIVRRAWDVLDSQDIIEPFVSAIMPQLIADEAIMADDEYGQGSIGSDVIDELRKHPRRRQRVITAILDRLVEDTGESTDRFFHPIPFVGADDLPWLLHCLQEARSDEHKVRLAEMIGFVLGAADPRYYNDVILMMREEPILANRLAGYWLEAVELGSQRAEDMRKMHELRTGARKVVEPRMRARPTAEEKIERSLERFENGAPNAWLQLILDLSIRDDGREDRWSIEADVRRLPGWINSDAVTRARILAAAGIYLSKGEPILEDWISTNRVSFPDYGAYRALRLLFHENNGDFQRLPAKVWVRWTPVVLAFPNAHEADQQPQQVIASFAYRHAPEVFLRTLSVLIEAQNSRSDCPEIYAVKQLGQCWDTRIEGLLTDRIHQRDAGSYKIGRMFSTFLHQNPTVALQLANTLIESGSTEVGGRFESAVGAAVSLIRNGEDPGWNQVWPVIESNKRFAWSVLRYLADYRRAIVVERLEERKLAELYVWIATNVPGATDSSLDDTEFEGDVGRLSYLARQIMIELPRMGTPESVAAIEMIEKRLPNVDGIKWTKLAAMEATRRRTWRALPIADIFRMIGDPDRRIIRTGGQLLQVVIESLDRLQADLFGETPAAPNLWNDLSDGGSIPKDENHLSDYIKRHLLSDLRGRGIVANREVEIWKARRSGSGMRTDIRVDAAATLPDGKRDIISVIIEVKGSWHPEVMTAMRTQLLSSYLTQSQVRHGIYLVGWFNCTRWTESSASHARSLHLADDMPTLQRLLDEQARELEAEATIKAYVLDCTLRSH